MPKIEAPVRPRSRPLDEAEYEPVDTLSAFDKISLEAASELNAEFDRMHPSNDGPRRVNRKHYTYWKWCENKRCPVEGHRMRSGHIFIAVASGGPYGPEQVERVALATHGTNLEQAVGKPGGWVQNDAEKELGLLWNDFDENFPWGPYTYLFRAPGGIFLMPIDQFIMEGFHRLPELARWRQDEIDQFTLHKCGLCSDESKEFLLKAHLDQHQEVKHPGHAAAIQNAAEFGKVSAQQLATLLNSQNEGGMALALKFLEAQEELLVLRAQLAANDQKN